VISDPLELLGFLLLACSPFLVAAGCCWRAVSETQRRSSRTSRWLARRIQTMGAVAMVPGGLCVAGGVLMALTGVNGVGNDSEILVVVGASVGLLGTLILLVAQPLLRISRLLRQLIDDRPCPTDLEIDRLAGRVEVSGWLLLLLTGLVFCAILTPLLPVYPIVLLFLVPILLWQRRRSRECQLLWLLALAAKHRRGLASEVEQHAGNWTGFHAARLRELAAYLRSGQSLSSSLRFCSDETWSPVVWVLLFILFPLLPIALLVRELKASTPLPEWCVSLIETGEETGTLDQALAQCAKEHLGWIRSRGRAGSLTGLMLYVWAYTAIIVQVVLFLMISIIPKYKAIFEGFGTEMPSVTVLLIELSDLIAEYYFLIVPIVLVPPVVLVLMDYRGWKDARLRVFSRAYRWFDAGGILRHLARAVARGEPLPRSLIAVANSHQRPCVAEAIARVFISVDSGQDCWNGLYREGFLNRRDLMLIEAAQRNGNLPWALREIADLHEKQAEFRFAVCLDILRPMAVICVGLFVAFIALGMFMPLVSLLNALS